MSLEVSGNWSGLMLDAEGRRARVEASLSQTGAEVKGDVQFSLIGTETVEQKKGSVVGRVDGGGAVVLDYSIEAKEGVVRVSFNGRVQPVQYHAKAVMYGTYEGPADHRTLSAGVAILWQYAPQR